MTSITDKCFFDCDLEAGFRVNAEPTIRVLLACPVHLPVAVRVVNAQSSNKSVRVRVLWSSKGERS